MHLNILIASWCSLHGLLGARIRSHDTSVCVHTHIQHAKRCRELPSDCIARQLRECSPRLLWPKRTLPRAVGCGGGFCPSFRILCATDVHLKSNTTSCQPSWAVCLPLQLPPLACRCLKGVPIAIGGLLVALLVPRQGGSCLHLAGLLLGSLGDIGRLFGGLLRDRCQPQLSQYRQNCLYSLVSITTGQYSKEW